MIISRTALLFFFSLLIAGTNLYSQETAPVNGVADVRNGSFAFKNANIIKDRGIFGVPDLVIEVLSSDKNYDLVTKKAVYEKCGVKEYWVVDPITKWCEGFVLTDGSFVSVGEKTGQLLIKMFDLLITF